MHVYGHPMENVKYISEFVHNFRVIVHAFREETIYF